MDAFVRRHRWLLCILSVALAVRLAAAVAVDVWLSRHSPPRLCLIAGDAEGYWDLAGDIVAGREYAVYQPPRRVLRMPGFPLCLALPRILCGDSLLAVRVWLALLGAVACWCVWRLGADLCGDAIGRWAALLAALSPVLVGFTPLLLSETTFALTMLLSLIAAGRLARRHLPPASADAPHNGSIGWALLTGVALAAGCYVRPSWLLAGLPFSIWLVVSAAGRKAALRDALLLHAALLLTLLPWGLRNRAVTGEFVLTTLWMGPSLYDGLNPHATGDSDMTFYDRDNLQAQGLSEADVNRHYRDAAWEFVRTHPGRTLQLAGVKLLRYWKPWPNADQFQHPLIAVAVAMFFVPTLLLAVVGGWQVRSQTGTLLLTVGPILYFAAIHMLFVSSLRYRLPTEYPLLILSAVGLQAALEVWRGRGRSPVRPSSDGEA